jgi:hypothetical protein
VFQPYTQVTDHRTELKVGDVQRVMDGDIDPFIEKFLKEFGARASRRLRGRGRQEGDGGAAHAGGRGPLAKLEELKRAASSRSATATR